MNKLRTMIRKAKGTEIVKDERGLTTVEYIIILCLIAVVGFLAWKNFGESVSSRTGEVTKAVSKLPTTPGAKYKGPGSN